MQTDSIPLSFYVPLTNGGFAIVDFADARRVLRYKWSRVVFTANPIPYARMSAHRNSIPMHRFILDAPPKMHVDHWNQNGLDNRRHNLRLATPSQNAQNRRRGRTNSSGYKGVSFHRKAQKWRACIRVNKKDISLGLYAKPDDADRAYDRAARERFGQFARLNFPSEGEQGA